MVDETVKDVVCWVNSRSQTLSLEPSMGGSGPLRTRERQAFHNGTLAAHLILGLMLPSCGLPSEPPVKSDVDQSPPTQAALATGKTFYVANSESGTVKPPWDGPVFGNRGQVPISSTTRAKNGSRSFKFEIPATSATSNSSTVMAYCPQVSMGSPRTGVSSICSGRGRFMSGYYSFWVYLDEGFTSATWNSALGWMTGVADTPSPISYIGFERWNATTRSPSAPLQVVFLLKNCQRGQYACPKISGYSTPVAGNYRMTASSPAGIVAMPRKQWVHLSIYYKMAAKYGQVTIWQDGVKIMDLTAPTMNTFGGHCCSGATLTNASGDMKLQHFIYGGAENAIRRMYVDDFEVTDYRVLP